ncbi:hypothetical protein V8C86DRAFT_2757376 [Haematococcus lacustris]
MQGAAEWWHWFALGGLALAGSLRLWARAAEGECCRSLTVQTGRRAAGCRLWARRWQTSRLRHGRWRKSWA